MVITKKSLKITILTNLLESIRHKNSVKRNPRIAPDGIKFDIIVWQ